MFEDEKILAIMDNDSDKQIKIGEFSGRKIEYSAVNSATGERGKRFTIMFLVRDRVVSFECWYLKENENAKKEKDKFLNSIKSN